MEALVLVGGFLAFAALGYYAISKLGDFLDNNQVYIDAEYNQQEKQDCLNIATADVWSMQIGFKVLKDIKKQHPHLHCTVLMGEEPELLHALRAGNVDVVIIHSNVENNEEVRQRKVILQTQPFINEDGVKITSVHAAMQDQFVVWKNQDHRSFTMEFVERLCGQGM